MLSKGRARAIPSQYTGRETVRYLLGAKSCSEVLSRMFKRGHNNLKWPIKVTGVLVLGQSAHAFIDSRTLPVSVLPLQHDSGSGWKVGAPLAGVLPVTGFNGPFPLKGLTR